jgi:hypothetical protein
MEGVKTWLSSQAVDFFDTGIQKLIPRYYKYLNSGGDYVCRYVCIFIPFWHSFAEFCDDLLHYSGHI